MRPISDLQSKAGPVSAREEISDRQRLPTTAIRAVADGQSQISPSMAWRLLTEEFKSMIQRTGKRQLVPTPQLTVGAGRCSS